MNTTTLTHAQAYEQVMTTFLDRLDAVLDRSAASGGYMLMWDYAMCVKLADGKASATGFEYATLFNDRATAARWARQIRNGANVHPVVTTIADAKLAARQSLMQAMRQMAKAPVIAG